MIPAQQRRPCHAPNLESSRPCTDAFVRPPCLHARGLAAGPPTLPKHWRPPPPLHLRALRHQRQPIKVRLVHDVDGIIHCGAVHNLRMSSRLE